MKPRVIIIGLDGVPYGMLADAARRGIMPHAGHLIGRGLFRPMRSSIPELSSVAWSSVVTGANPGEHGIFGFTDLAPHSYRMIFPNFHELKVQPFWEHSRDRRHIIMNVPATFPARELNGVLISGFVALDLERAVYPRTLVPTLKELDYRVDVDADKAHQSMELFFTDLHQTLEARIAACHRLWDEPWDTFMFVETGTDRVMHFLWDAYVTADHRFHDEVIAYFARVDEVIGDITSRLRPDDTLLMLSDHGFETLNADVYVNALLRKEGYVSFAPASPMNFSTLSSDTVAFALDPGRIYVHTTDRYPRGRVAPADKERVLRELTQLFAGWTYEGKKVIRTVHRSTEIYHGAHVASAPDLVLESEKGFNLKGVLNAADVAGKGIFTGKHSGDDAFLLALGSDAVHAMPAHPTVCDIVPLITASIGEGNEHHAQR